MSRLWVRPSLEGPEARIYGVVLLIWHEDVGREVDITRVLRLVRVDRCTGARIGRPMKDSDFRIDRRLESVVIGYKR